MSQFPIHYRLHEENAANTQIINEYKFFLARLQLATSSAASFHEEIAFLICSTTYSMKIFQEDILKWRGHESTRTYFIRRTLNFTLS